MTLLRSFALAAALCALLALPALARAQHETEHAQQMRQGDDALGTVHFETTCSAEAQPRFNRAVALLHSFWFPAAIDAFNDVLELDPACAMAEWGIAMARWGNPLGSGRQPQMLVDGWNAVARATAIGAKSERERDYIAAVTHLYTDHENTSDRSRGLAYETAMNALVAAYPDDSEAAIFYAMALNGTADLTDKTYAKQLEAAAILEPAYDDQPNHPGIAHYLIHTYDVPALANRAIDAARSYAAIAPAAPHALHMPSHTFTRLGYWQESIDTNIKAADAAIAADSPPEALHAMDYMIYGYLQTGQDAAAREVVGRMNEIRDGIDAGSGYGVAGFYAVAAIQARYTLERRDWEAAANLDVLRTATPFVDAIVYFARAMGAARSGDPARAREDVAQLDRARDTLGGNSYWATKVDIHREVAEAWIAFAEGATDDALATMRRAADREDQTEKSAISPGPVAPARELLGQMLLEAGRNEAALEAFQATTAKEPGRFRGIYGAARAAELSGNRELAERFYTTLLEVAARADDGGRPEIAQARAFLTGN